MPTEHPINAPFFKQIHKQYQKLRKFSIQKASQLE
jgi:predicted PP-loop superfamily ATPase